MKKVKVLEFITSMGEGGAQSLVKDYALMLNKDLFEVSIFCIYPIFESGPGQLVKKANVKVKSVYPRYNKIYSFINKILGRYVVSYKLKQYMDDNDTDCLHAHLAVLKYLLPIKQYLPKNIIYTCHNEPMKNFKSLNSVEFKAALDLIKSRKMRLVALHKQMQRELNEIFGIQNTVVVYNGIDICRFQSITENKSVIRQSLGLSDNDFVIGHVGRFSYPKNHVFIVEIFNEIYKYNKNARLMLVGTGELKTKVKEQVFNFHLENTVLFLDQRSDINRLLKAMDVFLFPSHYEGLPVSLIEAQVVGLKCVVSTNITDEAFLTPKLYTLSLAESIEKWADVILNDKGKGIYSKDINTFEMKEDIKVLEALYSSNI